MKQYDEIIDRLTKYEEMACKLSAELDNPICPLVTSYWGDLCRSLCMERDYTKQVKEANKDILKFLVDLLDFDRDSVFAAYYVYGQFLRLYDTYHPVRNRVETLDSVKL